MGAPSRRPQRRRRGSRSSRSPPAARRSTNSSRSSRPSPGKVAGPARGDRAARRHAGRSSSCCATRRWRCGTLPRDGGEAAPVSSRNPAVKRVMMRVALLEMDEPSRTVHRRLVALAARPCRCRSRRSRQRRRRSSRREGHGARRRSGASAARGGGASAARGGRPAGLACATGSRARAADSARQGAAARAADQSESHDDWRRHRGTARARRRSLRPLARRRSRLRPARRADVAARSVARFPTRRGSRRARRARPTRCRRIRCRSSARTTSSRSSSARCSRPMRTCRPASRARRPRSRRVDGRGEAAARRRRGRVQARGELPPRCRAALRYAPYADRVISIVVGVDARDARTAPSRAVDPRPPIGSPSP